MTKTLRRFLIVLFLLLHMPLAAWAQGSFDLSLGVDANERLPDSISVLEVNRHPDNWLNLLKTRRLNVNDTSVQYPKFINFCLKVYRWADYTFNHYDPEYVQGSGKHGKVRLVSDNWLDSYYIRFSDGRPIIMVSNPYPNIGFQANYYAVSAGYSVDFNSLLTGSETHHKKWNMSFTCARLYFEGYLWKNKGGTKIRRFDTREIDGGYNFKGIPFDGLNFKSFGLLGMYIFNHERFSFASAYSLSNFQVKSQGTWMVGINGTFYNVDFDFDKLPSEVKDHISLPYDNYRLDYNSVTAMGGYSYNWVFHRRWLFNVTLLPSLGVTSSSSSSSAGHRTSFSAAIRHMTSLTYNHRQFFVTANSIFHGNMYFTHSVGFMSGIENFQVSTGVRF